MMGMLDFKCIVDHGGLCVKELVAGEMCGKKLWNRKNNVVLIRNAQDEDLIWGHDIHNWQIRQSPKQQSHNS